MSHTTQDLKTQIRESGLRSTTPRVAVLRVLLERNSPMSHPEVVEALREDGFDRATLYRNLRDMAEAGLLERCDMGDKVWRFGVVKKNVSEHSRHPHFVCNDCGAISCLGDLDVSTGSIPGVSKIDEVILKGTCDECVD